MSQYENLEYMFLDGVGEYNFPEVQPIYELPQIDNWIEFDYAIRSKKPKETTGIHFFEYDSKFARCWAMPDRYTEFLKDYGCVVQTDFSMYRDFPKAVQIWNKYRNHWLAAYWQRAGIKVIPQIGWSTPDCYDWQFEGYPKGSIVAVSNVGCMREKEAKELFNQGYKEMLKRLEPKQVLMFAHTFDAYEGNVHFIRYSMDKEVQR